MSTSGTTTHSVTAAQIIEDALYDCHALEEGESPSGTATTVALRRLNAIAKRWMTRGDLRWKVEEGVLFLIKDRREYILGTDHCAVRDWGYTTLSAAASASATTLTVTATAEDLPHIAAADGYFVGIELDDGTRQWTTIKGTPGATSIVLDVALTGAAASGNTVFWYATKVGKALRVMNPRRGVYNSSEVPMRMVSRQEYADQPSKTSTGQPVLAYYDPLRTTGRLSVWPVSDTVKNVMWFSYEPLIEDFATTGNEPDFPIEWQLALSKQLAVELAPTYNVPSQKKAELKSEATEAYDELISWNADTSPYRMVLERWR